MPRYRNKIDGGEVEAHQLSWENAAFLQAWCNGFLTQSEDALDPTQKVAELNVPTNAGMRRASGGDWVIRARSFQVIRQGVFALLYEEV